MSVGIEMDQNKLQDMSYRIVEQFADADFTFAEGMAVLSALLATSARDDGITLDDLMGRVRLVAEYIYSDSDGVH